MERNELYDLDLPDHQMSHLLELLMRRYTSVFSYPVPVDEEYIAAKLGLTVSQLRQLLYRMSLEHVIKYIPCDHATVLYLHHERLRPKNVNLDPERYNMLKSAALDRTGKMIDYINEDDTCRSSYLLQYFGQKDSPACGTCDICRNGLSGTSDTFSDEQASLSSALVEYINNNLGGRYCLDDVARRFCSPTLSSSDNCMSILRLLIDSGKIPSPQC